MEIDNSVQSAFRLYQEGDLQQAKLVCREILKEQPDNEAILYLLGIVLTQLEEYDSAIIHLERSLRVNVNNADAYLALGAIFQTKGVFHEAVKYYQKAVEIDPVFAEAYENLGDIFREKQLPDKAVHYYKKAIRSRPDSAEIYNKLGNIFKGKRQLDLAAYYYRKALLYNADYAEAHNNMGSILLLQGRPDEAIRYYQKALKIAPGLAGVRANLEDALHEKRQFEEAVNRYKDWLRFSVKIGAIRVEMLINSVINQFYLQSLNVQYYPDVNYDDHYNAGPKGQVLRKIIHATDKIGNIDRFFSDLDRLCTIRDHFANYEEMKSPQKEKGSVPTYAKPDDVAALERLHREFTSTAANIEAQLVRVLGSPVDKK